MADKFFDAMFTASVIGGGSGPAPLIVAKNITANGTYSAVDDQADGYNPVVVDVPNSYTASDEGKVVSGGELVAQTSTTATANGTINTTTNNEVVVNVPNTYTAGDEGKVVNNGELVAQTSTTATANGAIDTTTNNEVVVNVPNTYTASDEGKVVNNGALVAQTNYGTVTENGTYDTTNNNSITVDVPSSAEVIPLTTTFGDIEQIEAYIVKTSTNIYIYGIMYVNNTSGQYITDIVFNYDSNIDVSGLNGKRYSFNEVGGGYNYYGTLIVNQNNKTITFNDSSYFMLRSGTYAIHPNHFSSN